MSTGPAPSYRHDLFFLAGERTIDIVASPTIIQKETPPELMGTGDIMTVNFGPNHPSTHGVLRLELVLDGEMVVLDDGVKMVNKVEKRKVLTPEVAGTVSSILQTVAHLERLRTLYEHLGLGGAGGGDPGSGPVRRSDPAPPRRRPPPPPARPTPPTRT